MLRRQHYIILKLLINTDRITARQIAEKLNISERSVRSRIKEINAEYKQNQIFIESRAHLGFFVSPKTKQSILNLLENHSEGTGIPVSSEERLQFLLLYLLNQKNYIKMDQLCDLLFISRGTLSSTLKEVEKLYNTFDIHILRRPNYGIKAEGSEFNIRRFLCSFFARKEFTWNVGKDHREQTLLIIREIVSGYIDKFRKTFSETALCAFINYIYIAIYRIRGDFLLSISVDRKDYVEKEDYYFIEAMSRALARRFSVEWSEEEKLGLAVWLAGNNIREKLIPYSNNLIILDDMKRIIRDLLNEVYCEFHIDFRENRDLYLALSQYMVSMDVRLKYGIPFANPGVDKIRSNYGFAYIIADFAARFLTNKYHTCVSEDETGYLAVIFALAVEQQELPPDKKNILVVGVSYGASSRLIKHHLIKIFPGLIGRVCVTGINNLWEMDFCKFDLIVSTVSIRKAVPLPVVEITEFFNENDQINVRRALEYVDASFWEKYYKKELFFPFLDGKNREQILEKMCRMISDYLEVPSDFFQSVMKREHIVSTDFGFLSALPHPDRIITRDTVVAAAILSKPVLWGRKKVSLVIMPLIGSNPDSEISKLYEGTVNLVSDEEAVNKLTECREFQTMIHLLNRQ